MSSLVLVVMHISLDKAAQLINWTFCFHGEHKEVQENGTLGQLVRVRLGMRQGGRVEGAGVGGIPLDAAFPWNIRLYQERPKLGPNRN